jgi:hypothetical protein
MSHQEESGGIASRLEHVRTRVAGCDDLASFHRRLSEGPPEPAGFKVSYPAVRIYHIGADYQKNVRYPSYTYLRRILEVFPEVRAEWLLLGEGHATYREKEMRARAAGFDRSRGGTVDLLTEMASALGLEGVSYALLLQVYDLLHHRMDELAVEHDYSAESKPRAKEEVMRLILEPIRTWDRDVPFEAAEGYVHAMVTALILAQRLPKRAESDAND